MSGFSALELAAIQLAEQRAANDDKETLRRLGVVHTPLDLVRFALWRVDCALRSELGKADGIASAGLSVLDPAVGTGVWLASWFAAIAGRSVDQHVIAFERDVATAQAVRELVTLEAAQRGVRLDVRCENTLEVADPWSSSGTRVIIGNPPWGARSLSRGGVLSDAWLREFRSDPDGEPLRERRSGVLSDDYVRFFRWALEQARTANEGAVVCFVSNASFVTGPVHRGMRGALVRVFDHIELLDLGGSALLSRTDAQDQGLFPVRVAAALTLCVRKPGPGERRAAVDYAKLRGLQSDKLSALRSRQWLPERSVPVAPKFSFCSEPPVRVATRAGFSLAEAFPFHAEGVQTNRDQLVTAESRALLLSRLHEIAGGVLALPASRHLDPQAARLVLRGALDRGEEIIGELAYRPFETRAYCTLTPLCHRPRTELAHALAASPLCLVSARKEPGASPWNMFGAVFRIADSSYLSTRSSCRTRLFPSHRADGSANVSAKVVDGFGARIGVELRPDALIAYVLGVLGSPLFRAQQNVLLKQDYPVIPWPTSRYSFEATCDAGRSFLSIEGASNALPDVALETEGLPVDPNHELARRDLRWLAPHVLQPFPLARIGVGEGGSLRACVGHHPIVELAYGARGVTTIREVMRACQRAAMWADAEKQADSAYQAACSV